MKAHFGLTFEVEFVEPDANNLVRFKCTLKNGDAPSHNQKNFIRTFGKGYSAAFDIVAAR